MLSVCVSWLLSCKMFLPISMICWAWENTISHHHWEWSLTDIDALYVDGFHVIIPRLNPSFLFIFLPITFMFIPLAVILNCDRERYTEFNQRLNVEAYIRWQLQHHWSAACLREMHDDLGLFCLRYWKVKQMWRESSWSLCSILHSFKMLSFHWQLARVSCETYTRC